MTEALVGRITVYPVKSLDGVSLEAARFERGGGLSWDRRWKIVRRDDGSIVNGKRSVKINTIRSTYHLLRPPRLARFFGARESLAVTVNSASHPEQRQLARLPGDTSQIAQWLSRQFGFEVELRENRDGGFPDDTVAPGPTIVSRSTLEVVASWFGLSLDEARARFRANIELDAPGLPAFWEYRLFGEAGAPRRFTVGRAVLFGTNPCPRCVVPSRDSRTGSMTRGFQKGFAERRRESLPVWSERSRFDHYYRLAVNTTVEARSWKVWIRVGDVVTLG
jgi:hypothetical protein